MGRTDEQEQAIKALNDAIGVVMRSNGMAANSVLGDWIVVAAEVRFDDDGDPSAAYHLMHPNGSALDHTALGLLAIGREFVMNPPAGDDDE